MFIKKILKLISSLLICQSAGIVGSIFTVPAINSWYSTLTKPSFSPPSWLFAPVWLALYTLMAVSLFLVWNQGLKKPQVKSAVILFLIHLVFNASWSISFFGLKNPLLGLANIIILLALIVIVIIKFQKLSQPAAWLLVPYFLWVAFATVLNFALWRLN